jgi:signal transduction histidine kinase
VLARRCPLPVELDVDVAERLPESVEVAGYYVVAEALTNATKHADASSATVAAHLDHGQLRLTVSDDGAGGAGTSGGSGLTGLRDRVEALSGSLAISSPLGSGTSLSAVIPITTP